MVRRAALLTSLLVLSGCDLLLGPDPTRDLAECTSEGEQRCDGNQPQACSEDWTWEDAPVCPEERPVCSGAGQCVAIRQIAAGNSHTCAVLTDGALRCWGRNDDGQIGVDPGKSKSSPVPVPLPAPVDIVALGGNENFGHTCAVLATDQREVMCWGSNQGGQLGNGTVSFEPTLPAEPVPGVTDVVDLSLGGGRSCALRADGTLFCWGTADNTPQEIAIPDGVLAAPGAVAAGGEHVCAIQSGTGNVFCWGKNKFGQCGQDPATAPDPKNPTVKTPTQIAGLTSVEKLAAGYYHTCARRTDKTLWCWGRKDCAQLGDGDYCGESCGGTACYSHTPSSSPLLGDEDILDFALGSSHSCILLQVDPRRVQCWGRNDFLQTASFFNVVTDHGMVFVDVPTSTPVLHALSLTSGAYHVCARTDRGPARCWGRNDFGQLGDGSTETGLPTAVVW